MKHYFVISILVLIWLSNCFVYPQDEEDDEDDDFIKSPKKIPPTIVSNNKQKITSKSTNQFKSKSKTLDPTTTDPYATSTYGPEVDGDSCSRPECLPYTCITDSKLFAPNGSRLVPASIGRIKKFCNKAVVFSKFEANWTQAQEICCAFNMRLFNIESYEQQQCFKSIVFESGFHPKIGGNQYWVGGSDEECEGKWGWCETKRPFASWTMWRRELSQDMQPSSENCACFDCLASLIRSDNRCHLYRKVCSDRAQFICEEFEEISDEEATSDAPTKVKSKNHKIGVQPTLRRGECARPRCLKHKCEIDPNFVTASGTILIPDALGKIRTICNGRYLFGMTQVTWTEAQEVCCTVGMRLLTITSEEQHKCLRAIRYNAAVYKVMGWNDYWVAASDEGCEGKYGWCATKQPLQPWVNWAKGEPNGGTAENCIYWTYFFSPLQNNNEHRYSIYDCKQRINFICEDSGKNLTASIAAVLAAKKAAVKAMKNQKMPRIKKEKVSLKSLSWNISDTGKKSNCLNVRCPLFSCAVHPKYLETSNTLPVSPSMGIAQTICGKKFVFSKIEANWTGANEGCCEVDMKLYNVESQEQMQCILQQNIESGMHYNLGEVRYWTAGWELPAVCGHSKTAQAVGWCNSRQVAEKWFTWTSQPEAKPGSSCLAIEYNVNVVKSQQDAKFVSADCQQINKYICEEL